MTLQLDAVADVPSLIAARVADTPDRTAFRFRGPSGEWQSVSWRVYQQDIFAAARGLLAKGLRPGEIAAILAPPSYRWEVAERAILSCGAIVVGIDHLASAEQKESYIKGLSPDVLIVAQQEQLKEIAPELLAGVKLLVCITDEPQGSFLSWSEILRDGQKETTLPKVSSEATATIVFTSGSGGEPKAVPYSQRQLVLAAKSILEAFGPADGKDVTLCWLPLSNLFQRVMNLCALTAGAETYFGSEPRKVMEDIAEACPSVFIGVPRFYEKVAERAQLGVAELPAWQRSMLRLAMAWTVQAQKDQADGATGRLDRSLIRALADRLVLRALRRRLFGRRIRLLITGSATTPMPVKEFFAGIDLPLMEAYAMTENIVPMTVHREGVAPRDCVGRPLPDNDIRIDESGEILVRGPGVFSGYWGEEQDPARFNQDGFFRTGDEGRFDDEGRLYLTGRRSDLIKTSTGRRIPPTPIEAELRQTPLVQDAVVIGNGRKCLTAVLALDSEAANRRTSEELLSQLSSLVSRTNQTRASYEQIAGCVVLRGGFSITEGHLTTNLKPRRGCIEDAVAQPLERLYSAINDNGQEGAGIQRVGDIAFAEAS